jgi:uncharacterized lipoprotein YmbA
LSEELRKLGENLKAAAQAAWHSEESQKLRQELRSGLSALEAGLKGATNEFTSGETGQRLKADVHDFSERVRSGQVETQVRQDLLAALRAVNETLQKNSAPKPPDDKPAGMV